jgi:hypothetical protein
LIQDQAQPRNLDSKIHLFGFDCFKSIDPERALAPLNRIAALDRAGSWPKIIADLDSLAETEIEHDRKRFVLRSAPRPAANLAAVGVTLPPTVYQASTD